MLDFTGERFLPTEKGELRYEHMHRYAWCLEFCGGKDVLDIACGEGYGSALLAPKARSVVGVDISAAAVAHAKATYGQLSNAQFICGSATKIPRTDASADVVVSFETIEHLAEQQEMLAEIRRVLRREGVLIISSPNKKVYSDERNYVNEYHVKELYFEEFDALLKTQFPIVSYLGQRFSTVSVLAPMGAADRRYSALTLRNGIVDSAAARFEKPMYFVAICGSDARAAECFSSSIFIEEETDLYKDQESTMRWASALDKTHRALEATHMKLHAEFDERSIWALALNAENLQIKNENYQIKSENQKIKQQNFYLKTFKGSLGAFWTRVKAVFI